MADKDISNRWQPLPYHAAVRDYLKKEESQIWDWFQSNRVREEQAESIRFELLKSTYRIDRETQPELYELADNVAYQLDLKIPVTIYQAQNPEGLNASLAFTPDNAHIILHGPVVNKLSKDELKALLAHELGHMLLCIAWGGEFLIAEQVLAAMTHDREADNSHFTTAKLFRLYTEVFCDRIALSVAGSPLHVVSMLVKLCTGLDEVDPSSYLRQAKEILGNGLTKSEGLSHPEAYIRAFAVELWQEDPHKASQQICDLIEGKPALDELDLTGQIRVMDLTRRVINAVLRPKWLQTDLMLAHARLFFDDYQLPSSPSNDDSLRSEVENGDNALSDYFCYVLLDFANADRELENAALAHSIGVAGALGLQDRFCGVAGKELKLRKKQLEKIVTERESIISAAAAAEASS